MTEPDLFTQPPYFNTVPEQGSTLTDYTDKAGEQNQRVLEFMRRARRASPSQVHQFMADRSPLTSIRRAMTTLAHEGLLLKTEEKVLGPYGRNEHVWSYVEP